MRFRSGIVALAAAGLVLTACSSGDDGGDAGAAGGIASPAADASGTLKVWLMNGSQPDSVVDAVNAKFKETYPNVTVDVQLQEWAGIQDKLTTSLGTDSTPDLVEIGNSLTAKYADAGLLADLSANASGLGVEGMLPGLKESGELEGVRYGVPYYGGVRIVVYKKSDFEKANVEVPTSLAELETVAGKLQDANKDNSKYSAFYFPGKYWYGAVPFVWTNGGDIASQDEGGDVDGHAELAAVDHRPQPAQGPGRQVLQGTQGRRRDQERRRVQHRQRRHDDRLLVGPRNPGHRRPPR